ncbi:MAG TPA: hypothetical protein VJJ72_01360 [Candidatus Paceibacterota bacterium]
MKHEKENIRPVDIEKDNPKLRNPNSLDSILFEQKDHRALEKAAKMLSDQTGELETGENAKGKIISITVRRKTNDSIIYHSDDRKNIIDFLFLVQGKSIE